MCEKAKGGQSHTAHRVVAFEPYAPAALFLRIALTLLVIKGEQLRLTFTPVSIAGYLYCVRALLAAIMGCNLGHLQATLGADVGRDGIICPTGSNGSNHTEMKMQ